MSGGLDSSIVTKEALKSEGVQNISLFTLNWGKNGAGETEKAQSVAKHLGTQTHIIPVTASKVKEILEPLQKRHYDPIAEGGLIPNEILAQELKQQGFKVILTGDGADEFQGGYTRYKDAETLIDKYKNKDNKLKLFKLLSKRLPISKMQQRMEILSYAQKHTLGELLSSMKAIFTIKELELLLNENITELNTGFNNENSNPKNSDLINLGMEIEQRALLANAFNSKEDITYSGHGIEHRAPFQSKDFIFKSVNTTGSKKNGKNLMKKIYKGKLPKETIEGKKQGYGVPIHKWINNELKETVITEIQNSQLITSRLMSEKLINYYIKNINKLHFSKRVWILYCLALYMRIHNVEVDGINELG